VAVEDAVRVRLDVRDWLPVEPCEPVCEYDREAVIVCESVVACEGVGDGVGELDSRSFWQHAMYVAAQSAFVSFDDAPGHMAPHFPVVERRAPQNDAPLLPLRKDIEAPLDWVQATAKRFMMGGVDAGARTPVQNA